MHQLSGCSERNSLVTMGAQKKERHDHFSQHRQRS